VSYCRCRDGAVENPSGWLGIGLSPSAKGPPMATLVRIECIHKTTGPPPMSGSTTSARVKGLRPAPVRERVEQPAAQLALE
jgi:hypothetical protein